VAAVLAGSVSPTQIGDWITAAPPLVLAAVGCRQDRDGRHIRPHPDTVTRLLDALGAQGLADATGAFLGARAGVGPVGAPIDGPVLLPALAVDGKAMCGAVDADGCVPYLLSAATHANTTVIASGRSAPSPTRCPSSSRCCAACHWPAGC
jgi:hypothetical protein